MQYPLYDRSGTTDENDLPGPPSVRIAPREQSAAPAREINVCHAGTCRARGADAVLTEIEELVDEVGGNCAVRQSGCLGFCNAAPNAAVLERGTRRISSSNVHTRILSLEASAKVVERATGKRPDLEGAGTRGRLAGLRAARNRQHAAKVSKWNVALCGLAEQAMSRPALNAELTALLKKAGFPKGISPAATMPNAIENYSMWSLENVTPATKHSAIFCFASADRRRGTPHPRGRGRMVQPITWHTTLLAEVGTNHEGPLPWVERDYPPVSSAKEWEQGRCEILIKIYPQGAATSWLLSAAPTRVWLSKPEKTLPVPGLALEGGAFRPASVLLLLAGTGVVALPQVLAHRDPTRQLALSTPGRDQLHVPIDLVLSCREDDVLLLPRIAQWCRDGDGARGVRTCTLLLTPPTEVHAPPFPAVHTGDAAEAERLLRGLANVRVLRKRLSPDLVSESFERMAQPCRVVVSGPGQFNTAARAMLEELVNVEEQVTILSA